jgi:hypothetical protein
MPAKKAKPGTERYRDERRHDPNPKMHGVQWHDHERGPVEGMPGRLARSPSSNVVGDGPSFEGMGKGKRGTRGAKRKRMSPVSKGVKGERSR